MSEFTAESIRRARAEDARAVQALVRSAYAKWVPVVGREPLPMVADYDRAVRDHEIDLVHANGELVGLIETIRNPDHLFIENVAVTPAHQGRGLGRRLLAHAERKAGDYGVAEIRLATNSAFESNVRLYQSIGYRIDRTEPFMGGAAIYMSKRIRLS
jgi:ribosomal protein S18 acetylase RimI-like enzyme